MSEDRLRALIASHVNRTLTDAHFPDLPHYSQGKVRDSYVLADGRRIIVTTDRQSAFDVVLGAVPFKGQVLTATARHWFTRTADIVANHVIAHPDPNVLVARSLDMLPVEVVVRDFLTGSTSTSIWPMYERGERRMYGLEFPDGLRKNEKLPATILTPTTKGAMGAHDVPVTPDEIVGRGLLTAERWEEVAATALKLFDRGRTLAAERGLILVDTKYEFGLDAEGRLTLADEVHTPDSSRYWRTVSYRDRLAAGEDPEPLDKDFLRRWVLSVCAPYAEPVPAVPMQTLIDFALRYVELYEAVTGFPFIPVVDSKSPRERVHANIRAYLDAAF